MRGNFVTTPRWSKGDARRFITRHLFILTGAATASAIASWIVGRVPAASWLDQSKPGIDITDAFERAHEHCLRELRETRLELERLNAARLSRERPLSVLVTLSEALPARVWIKEISGLEDTIVINGYAASDSDIRYAVSPLEASGRLKDLRLLSSDRLSSSTQGEVAFTLSADLLKRSGG